MNDPFTKKVRAAAVAGWWTILTEAGIITVQWLMYLSMVSNRPDWVLSLFGNGVTWSMVITIWLWAIVTLKVIIWVMLIVVIWLTLWARQLSREK
jgi:hypothetical protein